jgi:hypothetical protein
MNKELFDELVGEPPASSISVDRIVAGRRRNAARTRLSVVAATTVAAAATAVIGFGPLPDNGTGVRAADQPRAKVPTTANVVPPTAPVRGKRTPLSQIVAVDAAVEHAVPGAQWPHATDRGDQTLGFQFEEYDGHPASAYQLPLRVAGRSGTLLIRIIFDGPAKGRLPAGTVGAWIPMPDDRVLAVESSAQRGQDPRAELLDQNQVDAIARDLAQEFQHG